MRGGPESQEWARESLKGPIALDGLFWIFHFVGDIFNYFLVFLDK
jgi:hypothetical protein